MLNTLESDSVEGTAWLSPFLKDFKLRFLTLLAGPFRSFAPALCLSILDPKLVFKDAEALEAVQRGLRVLNADGGLLSPYDMKRLQVCGVSSQRTFPTPCLPFRTSGTRLLRRRHTPTI